MFDCLIVALYVITISVVGTNDNGTYRIARRRDPISVSTPPRGPSSSEPCYSLWGSPTDREAVRDHLEYVEGW